MLSLSSNNVCTIFVCHAARQSLSSTHIPHSQQCHIKDPRRSSHSLDFTYVPLPLETDTEPAAGATAAAEQKLSSSSAYSKFCTPIIIKDSRLAQFQFSLNYSTHVPNKNLISFVGNGGTTNGSNGGKGISGYVL